MVLPSAAAVLVLVDAEVGLEDDDAAGDVEGRPPQPAKMAAIKMGKQIFTEILQL